MERWGLSLNWIVVAICDSLLGLHETTEQHYHMLADSAERTWCSMVTRWQGQVCNTTRAHRLATHKLCAHAPRVKPAGATRVQRSHIACVRWIVCWQLPCGISGLRVLVCRGWFVPSTIPLS